MGRYIYKINPDVFLREFYMMISVRVLLFPFIAVFVSINCAYSDAHGQSNAKENHALSLSRHDFAYGIILNPSVEAPIYQLSLPKAVYQGILCPDLEDIRIFNAAGTPVPHLLEMPQQKAASNTPSEMHISIPFFPLYGAMFAMAKDGADLEDAAFPLNTLRMNVIQNADGTILRVESRQQEKKSPIERAPETGYLLDMSHLTTVPFSLKLKWPNTKKNRIATIQVKGSNDLTHWAFITRSTLATLEFGGHTIHQDVINLSRQAKQYQYLLLSRLSGDPDMTIHQVTALTTPPPFEVKREWLDLSNGRFRGHSNPSGVKHSASSVSPLYITYDTGGFFPVDALQLNFREKNSIVQASFHTGSEDHEVWHHRCGGLFYSLQVEGTDLTNKILRCPGASHRFWRMEVIQDGAGLQNARDRGEAPPLLQIGWRPHDLIFLAQGEAPYVLAWGSGKLKAAKAHHLLSAPSASNMILQTLADRSAIDTQSEEGMVRRVIPGEHIILGGEQALQLPSPPLPWKKWMLWGILVAGVILVAAMTWKLALQIHRMDS